MGETEVNEERRGFLRGLAGAEVFQHLIGVPGAAGLVGAAAFGGVADDAELLVGGRIAVALLAGTHGLVTGAVEDGSQCIPLQVRRAVVLRARPDRQVPHRAAAHDHVARRRADRAAERSHVIGAVQDHALGREAVDVRAGQRRLRVVEFEIERRLVVGEDEQDVRSAGLGRAGGRRAVAEQGEAQQGGLFHGLAAGEVGGGRVPGRKHPVAARRRGRF
jgi:hypothetical protein